MISTIASRIPPFVSRALNSPAGRVVNVAGTVNGIVEGLSIATDTDAFRKDEKGLYYTPTVLRGAYLITGASVGGYLGYVTAPVSVPVKAYDVYLKYEASQQKKGPH